MRVPLIILICRNSASSFKDVLFLSNGRKNYSLMNLEG